MAYNNKNVNALFGCYFTSCVPNQHLWFSKFPIFKIFGFNRYDCRCFRDKDSFCMAYKQNSSFYSILKFIKKLLRHTLRYTIKNWNYYRIKTFQRIILLLFSANSTSYAFKRVLNLRLNSRCVYLLFVNKPCLQPPVHCAQHWSTSWCTVSVISGCSVNCH